MLHGTPGAWEMRAPMNAIIGFNRLVMRRCKDILPDKHYQNLGKIAAFEAGGVDYVIKPFQVEEVSARVGLLHSDEDQDAYAEAGPNIARAIGKRHIDLGQALIGFDLAYRAKQFKPYSTFTYINDLGRDNGTRAGGLPGAVSATQPSDDDEVQAGLGVRSMYTVCTRTGCRGSVAGMRPVRILTAGYWQSCGAQ